MHEISMAQNIINNVEKICIDNKIQKVTKIVLRIGKSSGFDEESLGFSISELSRNTICENAVIEWLKADDNVCSGNCGNQYDSSLMNDVCSVCTEKNDHILNSGQVILQSIEGE